MAELSAALTEIIGASGAASFDAADVRGPRAVFLVARDHTGQPIGCGALRPLSAEVGEVKRMYARSQAHGVGTAILAALERYATEQGYAALWLETRRVNTRAVQFYLRRGYQPIPNYGRYQCNAAAICLGKRFDVPAV
jgi:GNAT superfamily N-acetyltransferase